MADSEFLLEVAGTDVAEDIWNWSTVTLTDAWGQRGTLTFTLRQAYDSATGGLTSVIKPFDDVVMWNRLTGETLFRGFVAPAPIAMRWVDPTWIETDVSCVAYDALLDMVVIGGSLEISKKWDGSNNDPAIVSNRARRSARDRIQIALLSALGDTRLSARISDGITSLSGEAYTQGDIPGLAIPEEPWHWDAGTTVASVVSDILANTVVGIGTSWGVRVLKYLPGMGFMFNDPDYACRGPAKVDGDHPLWERPAAVTYVRDGSALVSGIGVLDSGLYLETDPKAPGVSVRTDAYGDPDRSETNGWQIVRSSFTSYAVDAVGLYDEGVLNEQAWNLSKQVNPNPYTLPVRWELTTGIVPFDVLVAHLLQIQTWPNYSRTSAVQSVQTTFVDGALDELEAYWPWYLDDGADLDDELDLNAMIPSVKPRRLRVHTLTLSGMPRTFLGNYATLTRK